MTRQLSMAWWSAVKNNNNLGLLLEDFITKSGRGYMNSVQNVLGIVFLKAHNGQKGKKDQSRWSRQNMQNNDA